MTPTTVRVLVSLAWVDLQPERQAVERALHRMRGSEHLGMEYFGSRPGISHDASLDLSPV